MVQGSLFNLSNPPLVRGEGEGARGEERQEINQAASECLDPCPSALAPRSIQERFERWLEKYPEALTEYVRIARKLKERGYKRYSSDGIFHVLRGERLVLGKDDAGYLVNDQYSSRMSRLAVKLFPDLDGFFEMRQLKSE